MRRTCECAIDSAAIPMLSGRARAKEDKRGRFVNQCLILSVVSCANAALTVDLEVPHTTRLCPWILISRSSLGVICRYMVSKSLTRSNPNLQDPDHE